jgi:hypothetical protein
MLAERFNLKSRFVIIADRGFAKVNIIGPIIEKVAFIIRVRSKVMFYLDEKGKGILLEDIVKKLSPGEIWEREGFYQRLVKYFVSGIGT